MPESILLTPDEHRAIAKVDGSPRISPSQISAEQAGDLMLGALGSIAMIRDREVLLERRLRANTWLTLRRNATPPGNLFSVIEGGRGGAPTVAGFHFMDLDEARMCFTGHIERFEAARSEER